MCAYAIKCYLLFVKPGGETLDECGLKFLLAVRLHTFLSTSLPPAHRAQLLRQGTVDKSKPNISAYSLTSGQTLFKNTFYIFKHHTRHLTFSNQAIFCITCIVTCYTFLASCFLLLYCFCTICWKLNICWTFLSSCEMLIRHYYFSVSLCFSFTFSYKNHSDIKVDIIT